MSGEGLRAEGGVGEREGRFVSLRWKLLLGFTLLFTLFMGAIFAWFVAFTDDRLLQRVHHDLEQTIAGAVAGVDVEALLGLAADGEANDAGFSDDARYLRLLDWLDDVHAIEPQAWPVLYVGGPEAGQITYLVDLFVRYDPSKATRFREVYRPDSALPLAGLQALTVSAEPHTDPWGTWISAYAPLLDASGVPVAAVDVDFDAEHLSAIRQQLRSRIYLGFAVSYLLLLLVVYLAAGAFSRPISLLTKAAERLRDGARDEAAVGFPRQRILDEVGVLTRVFESMASHVVSRERSLLHEVRSLRIEIDERRRQEAVSEIVETDFFRDLQKKAADLKRRNGRDAETETRS